MSPMHDDETLYDLGVLFVHGIGQSAQGETLLHFGEPLRACIEEIAAAPHAQGAAAASVQTSVSTARLDPRRSEGPARAELRIGGAARLSDRGTAAAASGAESRWLLAEAWWAKKFPTPTFTDIVAWSFEVLPWTLISHFDRRFRRVGFRVHDAFDGPQPFRRGLALVLRWLVEGMKVTVALALSPLLLVAVGAVVVLGLVPFAPVRNFAGAVQRKLAATVGDSFVFMQQRFTGAAICQSVTEDLAWVASRCKRVVVIAHSQGAAIAHRVLQAPATAPCDRLITFGSGLAKLAEMERTRSAPGRPYLWLSSLGALIAAASLVAHLVFTWNALHSPLALVGTLLMVFIVVAIGLCFLAVDLFGGGEPAQAAAAKELPIAWRWSLAFVLVACGLQWTIAAAVGSLGASLPALLASSAFACGVALAYSSLRAWHIASGRSVRQRAQWMLDRDVYRRDFQFHNRNMRWADFFSSSDPVPNGQLLDEFLPTDLYSQEVSNARSLVLDHTAYWNSKDDFVPRVARMLLEVAGLAVRPASLARAAARRRWRVMWRAVGRWMTALLALALFAQWVAATPRAIDRLARKLPVAMQGVGSDWSVPLVVAIALWAIASALLWAAWHSWDEEEVRISLADGEHAHWSLGFLIFLATLSALSVIGIWEISGTSGLIILAVGLSIAAAPLMSAQVRNALILRSSGGPRHRLRQLRLDELNRTADIAFEHNDANELTWLGRVSRGLDDDLSVRALRRAMELRSANAAWSLGLYFDALADQAGSDAEKASLLHDALEAFSRGAEFGDAYCAWRLASIHKSAKQPQAAIAAYERAFELGDIDAAHSLGLLLDDEGRKEEAFAILEEGARRGDPLSARFLASRLEFRADDVRWKDPVECKKLRTQALELYRAAFDLGEVEAARYEGDLCREMSDIVRARHAYDAGARLRHAQCALRLGALEEEEEQDVEAAQTAYALAIRLDEFGTVAAAARYRVGVLLEKEGREQAALRRYHEAMGVAGSPIGSAEAAIAAGRLLEKQRGDRRETKMAYERGITLSPRIAGEAYVGFLGRSYDREAAAALYAKGVDGLTAPAIWQLGRLLRYENRTAARELFELAFKNGSAPAAVDLYNIVGLDGREQAQRMLDEILKRDPWFVHEVADRFEQDHQKVVAEDLRARAEKAQHPAR